ncbi:MAG TPA: AAA family ATPase, partial [Rhodothermia bacterium]|nr:AAA family ATPase [Rhodothermia bacterium]
MPRWEKRGWQDRRSPGALSPLNPIIEKDARFDVTEDYPRLDVEDYEHEVATGQRPKQTETISATFVLTSEEMAPVKAAFGADIFRSNEITVTRGYDPKEKPQLYVNVNINENAAVKALVEGAGLPDASKTAAAKQPTLDALQKYLIADSEKRQQQHQTATKEANALPDATQKASALEKAKKLEESAGAMKLRTDIPGLIKDGGLSLYIWRQHLREHLPKFLYFDEYYQMTGQLNVQKLKERQAADKLEKSDRPMLGLIELARLNLDQLINPQNTQFLKNKLQGTSNHLSGKILQYWSQNKHLHVQFDVRPALAGDPEGMNTAGTTNLWGEVYDSAHGATVRLGTRSRGFVWFFSFLAWFSQQQRRNIPIILLLDEPGLILHASAQADLLRYIELELKEHHQVIYTTHSPFMIDSKNFDRVRIVRDRTMEEDDPLPREQSGTKVISDVLEADPDSLFPLQGAIGYDIAQTLFIGPNSLIIEGASDLVYLPVISDVLGGAKRVGLDARWTLTPVGGSDKVHTFVALLGAQELNIAALLDVQKADVQK